MFERPNFSVFKHLFWYLVLVFRFWCLIKTPKLVYQTPIFVLKIPNFFMTLEIGFWCLKHQLWCFKHQKEVLSLLWNWPLDANNKSVFEANFEAQMHKYFTNSEMGPRHLPIFAQVVKKYFELIYICNLWFYSHVLYLLNLSWLSSQNSNI